MFIKRFLLLSSVMLFYQNCSCSDEATRTQEVRIYEKQFIFPAGEKGGLRRYLGHKIVSCDAHCSLDKNQFLVISLLHSGLCVITHSEWFGSDSRLLSLGCVEGDKNNPIISWERKLNSDSLVNPWIKWSDDNKNDSQPFFNWSNDSLREETRYNGFGREWLFNKDYFARTVHTVWEQLQKFNAEKK